MASRSPGRRTLPAPGLAVAAAPLAVFAVLALVHPLFGVLWWAWLALLAGAVGVEWLRAPPRGGVNLERDLPRTAVVARGIDVRVVLSNGTRRAWRAVVRECSPQAIACEPERFSCALPSGGRVERLLHLRPLERGVFALGPATVRLTGPFGLLTFQEDAGPVEELRVLPGRPSGEIETLLLHADRLAEIGERKLRLRGTDREFESLRSWVQGDEMRLVDWKSTARRRRPTVRQYQMERNAEVLLALDCGRLMGGLVHGVRKLDLTMTALLDLAAVALHRSDRVGLLAFDSRPRIHLPPRGGTAQLGRLREALAGLEAGWDQTSYGQALLHLETHHRKRSVVVCLTDFTDEISARDMLGVMAALARRHLLVFAGVTDPQLVDILREAPRHAAAAFQKGVAAELIVERRRVIAELNRLGAFTVDGEPHRIGVPLINRYLEARLRSVV